MDSLLQVSKQITTDVVVHQATTKALYVFATIAYDLGANVTSVNANITSSLQTFFSNLPFGAWIQFSDVIQAIHNVPGVDNVRLSTSADVGGGSNPYGIAWRQNSVITTDYHADFKLNDSEVAAFDGISILRKAANTF